MTERHSDETVRESVREAYGRIARTGATCCDGEASAAPEPCPGVPAGADMGLGSGDPLADAVLSPGETVVDLGSGGGVDCFRAARQVGDSGRVIGIDMTPEMLATARRLAAEGGYANVEFRLGEIERLPVADASVDAVISNCVVNLSPDKPAVYGEAYRVLRPGGRLAISDIVAANELPEESRGDLARHAACIAGAETIERLERILADAGFEHVRIEAKGGPAGADSVFRPHRPRSSRGPEPRAAGARRSVRRAPGRSRARIGVLSGLPRGVTGGSSAKRTVPGACTGPLRSRTRRASADASAPGFRTAINVTASPVVDEGGALGSGLDRADDEIGVAAPLTQRHLSQIRQRPSARQPISRRQKPSGQSMRSTAS